MARAFGAGEGQIPEGDDVPLDVVQGEPALETGDLDVVEGVARLGHKAVFHPLPPACKVYLGRRVGLFDGSRDGQSRVDMSGSAAGCDQYTHGDLLLIWMCSISHVGVEPDGVVRLFFFPLFPLGRGDSSPLEAGALAAPADVYHHAHLGQQQDEAGAPEEKKGQRDAGVGQGVGDDRDVADTCHAIWAMMPMPTSVQ